MISEKSLEDSKQYIISRFSENLTKFDVRNLFESIKREKGSVAAASKEIDIERKTVYDWETNDADVKLATKRKILMASINDDINRTLSYLIEKSQIDYSDLLQRFNNLIFEEIMVSQKKSEISDLIRSLERNIKANKGLISGINEERLNLMLEEVNKKARAFEVPEIACDISLMSSEKLANKIFLLIDVFSEQKLPANNIAAALELPESFVAKACQVYGYLGPSDDLKLRTKINSEPLVEEIPHDRYRISLTKPRGYIASKELK